MQQLERIAMADKSLPSPAIRRACMWATILALAHAFGWAAFYYSLELENYQKLESRQVELVDVKFTSKDPQAPARSFWRLYLKVRQAGVPQAPVQDLLPGHGQSTAELREYSEQHRPGDVVTAWVYRRSGDVYDIFPPEPPDFPLIYAVAFASIGLLTAIVTLAAFAARLSKP
jgi:hypothetical protein